MPNYVEIRIEETGESSRPGGTRSIRLEARRLGSWDAKGKHKGDRINRPARHRFVRPGQRLLAEASKFLTILHALLQNSEIILVYEFPVAGIPGYFGKDIELNHLLDQTTGGSMGNPG
jgi:hypothetical protein